MAKKLLSALAISAALTLSATAHAASTNVFTGVDFAHDSWYAYLGGVTALQGQDILSQSGFLGRASVGYGQYDYNKPGTGNIDGDVTDLDLMVGYGENFSGGRVSGYIGGDWINHDLSPDDPLADADGSRFGLKGQLEVWFSPADHFQGSALGSYSTAFDTYWSHFDVGYNFGAVTIGPEVGLIGNDDYNEFRYGAQVGGIDLGFASTALHAGVANSNRSGGDGGYGAVSFARNF
jgi:hypothetical protein